MMGDKSRFIDRRGGGTRGENAVVLAFPSFYVTLTAEAGEQILSPKVFTGARRYSANGIGAVTRLEEDDNLIIKGDNLLVLVSLRQRYAEKVKCIYIDPPYNTGAENFSYNDRFSRSTWLTFMQNRLAWSKRLLAKDGVLLVQCSFHHYPYLKVLLDEVMGEENYKLTFHILVRHPERILAGDKEFNDVIEYILVYSAHPGYKMPKRPVEKRLDDYVYAVELLTEGQTLTVGGKKVAVFRPDEYIMHKGEPKADRLKKIPIRGGLREKNSSGRFYTQNLEGLKGKYPPLTLFRVDGIGDDRYGFRYFQLPKAGCKNGIYYQGMPVTRRTTNLPYANFCDFVAEYNFVHAEGGVEFRYGKKPEALIGFLLEIFTEERDLVLDFFLGSGTTAATAHKMNRQYIGVELLDYGVNDSVIRLQKVINGEPSGVSKAVNWQGGGSFVFCELKKRDHTALPDGKGWFPEDFDYSRLYVDAVELAGDGVPLSKAEKQFNRSFYRQD